MITRKYTFAAGPGESVYFNGNKGLGDALVAGKIPVTSVTLDPENAARHIAEGPFYTVTAWRGPDVNGYRTLHAQISVEKNGNPKKQMGREAFALRELTLAIMKHCIRPTLHAESQISLGVPEMIH